MKNYKIEGNINFFDELYKSLDNEESDIKLDTDDTKCLITNELLNENFVTMECGHKFNYKPLYYDLINYKQKFNYQETKINMLKKDEIRCPYCRRKQKTLLPFVSNLNFPAVEGINLEVSEYNKYDKNTTPYLKCEFLLPNKYFNINYPEVEVNKENLGNVKYLMCNCWGSKFVENTDMYIPNNDKIYCYKHKKTIISEHKKEIKKKEKEEAKQQKLKEKEDAKQQKLKKKEEAKQEKLKEKEEEKQKKLNENEVIIQENIILNSEKCIQFLKTGPNKGKQCGCKIFMNNMCRRHYIPESNIIELSEK